MTQGDSLQYLFDKNVNFFGEETNVKLQMREASLFSRYDEVKHAYVVDGTLIPDSMLGLHKITVEASFLDPKGQTQLFTKSFYLHVKGVPEDAEETPLDDSTKRINATDWTGFILMEPQPFNKNRPIPYIADFN